MSEPMFQYFRLEEKHLPDVQFLFLKVFHKQVTLDYLRKKYDSRYLGIPPVGFIAYHEEKVVAFYGAIPQKFKSEMGEFFAAHACDSFTLDSYQRMGLHYQLAIRSYEVMKSEGIRFVYAFHSENTFHSTEKLNWITHQHMKRFHLFIKTVPLAKIFPKLGLGNFYQTLLSKKLGVNQMPEMNYTNSVKSQVYNNQFLLYKNGFGKHFNIRINNCDFFIKVDSVMKVGVFQHPDITSFQMALRTLKRICFFCGINEIQFQVSEN